MLIKILCWFSRCSSDLSMQRSRKIHSPHVVVSAFFTFTATAFCELLRLGHVRRASELVVFVVRDSECNVKHALLMDEGSWEQICSHNWYDYFGWGGATRGCRSRRFKVLSFERMCVEKTL